MEQKSNVQYRAEKEYKNSREKFFLLLRVRGAERNVMLPFLGKTRI